MDKDKIGAYIKAKRNELGYSQKELAEQLHVTPQAISKWENGRGLPDIEIIKDMSTIFKVNMEDVLNGEESLPQSTPQSPKKFYYIIASLLIIICIGIVGAFVHKASMNAEGSNFEFMGVSSNNDSFSIKGVAAYSKEQKSLYISSIKYTDECRDLYTAVELGIYEVEDGVLREVASVGSLEEATYTDGKHLPDILESIDVKIDQLDTTCSDISTSLEMMVSAKRIDGVIITFEVPLEIGESCEIRE